MASTHSHQPAGDREPVIRPIAEGRVISPGGYPGSDEQEIARRLEMFEVEMPERRLKDLILPDETLQQIRSLLTKIRYHGILYEEFGLAEIDPYGGRTAINLYGPPGTGKSFTAEAMAHELGKGIIRANYAEIESKYVGETAKNIKAAFQKAQETDAVLFFDEADSILGRRLTHVRQSTDHAVNVSRSVMLLEMDHFSGVAIFATNLASNYDPAFVRRILGHIELPLPNAEARARLWLYLIPKRMPSKLDEQDWERLVRESDGLAGGDILNIVINAASRALEREGPTCNVVVDDFLAALAASKRARKEIGMRRRPKATGQRPEG